ncbi:MAG: signal peptidase I [Candidatus Paceibacterota bacterium]
MSRTFYDRIQQMKENFEKKESGWKTFWELARFTIIAIAIVIPIRIFIAQPFIVSGSSMYPTFENRQYLVVDEISYKLNNPQRDDVVIFRYPNDTKKFFIKRIIGLPNETVNIKGSDITIINKEHPDGFKLNQPYVKNTSNNNLNFELKNDEYFVMGDNRNASSDSRSWGAVPRKLLIGKAFLRLFPINKISIMPGNYKQVE